MSTKSKMSPASKAVLNWSGVTLEELSKVLEHDAGEIQYMMDDPSQRVRLLSSINSIQQGKVWMASLDKVSDLLRNLPERFDSDYENDLHSVLGYIIDTLNNHQIMKV